jgi:UTP-glucose-1-phosphate uridylyltransferase
MKPTLLVLAAGLGARYGGLKQIDSVGPNGETLIDYSIYDGMAAGFGKVVFVIRHYFEDAFKARVSRKFDRFVHIALAYQEMESRLGDFLPPADREKPWGTGHAILVAEETIDEPFAVINADDYYGPNSLKAIADSLGSSVSSNQYAMVGYTLRNTLSEHGAVARGVTECDEHMFLRGIIERKKIEKTPVGARYLDPDETPHTLTGDEIVSMNLWGFHPSIFAHLESQFARFLENNGSDNNAEMFIPSVVDTLVTAGEVAVKVLRTDDPWFGVTYRADRSVAMSCIRERIEAGVYPERLWG